MSPSSKSNVTVLSVEVEAALALVAASWATPALIAAVTVPSWVMPETDTVYVVPDPATTAVVAPAEPLSATSPVAKSATLSLNTTSNTIGDAVVGSTAPAWLIVTVGATLSNVTCAAAGAAVLALFAKSTASEAPTVAVTVPGPDIPVTATS